MIEDIARIVPNIEEMNNLIAPEQKNFDSEVNRMSVFDAFNETVNEFFENIYSDRNKESLKKMVDEGKITPDCVVIMNGEHKPCKRVFDKLNIPVLFDNCVEIDKAFIVTDKETVRVLKNMADFENPAENTPRKWLVVVKHFEDCSGREFTFESEKAVEKGDMVLVKTKYGESMAKVKNVYEVTGNPELISFIANAIGVKTITGKVIDVYVKKNETK